MSEQKSKKKPSGVTIPRILALLCVFFGISSFSFGVTSLDVLGMLILSTSLACFLLLVENVVYLRKILKNDSQKSTKSKIVSLTGKALVIAGVVAVGFAIYLKDFDLAPIFQSILIFAGILLFYSEKIHLQDGAKKC